MSFLEIINSAPQVAARIKIYGTIGRWQDVDERDFAAQLEEIGNKDIDIFINSNGGSVYTAVSIYQMLSRHRAKINITIDGIAASAATIITSIPNAKVTMPLGSMMMIHSAMLWPDASNATELRRLADILDKTDSNIQDIYKLKTKQSAEKLKELMSTDTYLTALEAVDLGFADEMGEQLNIAAHLSRDKMVINGLKLDPNQYKNMPESWFTANNQPNLTCGCQVTAENESKSTCRCKAPVNKQPKGNKPMDLNELKAQHPNLYEAVLTEGKEAGAKSENERIKAIEEMAMKGHEDLIAKAKFDSHLTAEALAVEIIKAEKQRKEQFLLNRQEDSEDLQGLGDNAPPPQNNTEEAAKEAKRAKILAAAKATKVR